MANLPKLVPNPGATLLLLALLVGFVAATVLIQNYQRSDDLKRNGRIDGVPVLNLEGDDFDRATRRYRTKLKQLLQAGYQRFKHGIYQLWGMYGFITIVSPDFLEELNMLPKGALDFYGAVQKVGISFSPLHFGLF